MKATLIKMILETLNPKLIGEILIGILWELAKRSDNTLDDKIVESLASNLGIELDKKSK